MPAQSVQELCAGAGEVPLRNKTEHSHFCSVQEHRVVCADVGKGKKGYCAALALHGDTV